jgi:hypothetical protein
MTGKSDMFLKIAVVNNSGNVGKSTICDTLLKPRLEGAEVIRIESINSDGSDDQKFVPAEFLEIFQRIDEADCAIVDVGSSNIEEFTDQLRKYKGSHEDFDFFIIPVVSDKKQQLDTISTIEILLDLNVEPERIRLIFNRVKDEIAFEKQFSNVLESRIYKSLKLKGSPRIPETVVFKHVSEIRKTFNEVMEDDRDFRELLKAASKEDRAQLSLLRGVKRAVMGFNDTLDIAFNQLNIA